MKKVMENSAAPSGRLLGAKTISKFVLAIAAISSLAQTSCTDREVAAGMAGAAVGAIIVGSAHSHHAPAPRCGTTRREICSSHRDYWGVYHRTCRWEVYDSCHGGYRRYLLSGVAKAADLNANEIASRYSMSFESAELLVSALAKSESGDPAGLSALGLERNDVERLAKFELPESNGIDRMARALNQAPEATKAMLEQLVAIAQAQDAARREADRAAQMN
jgi:hypothetical protein